MVVTYGKMAENMKGSIRMTKNMDKELMHGQMDVSMKETGKMEDNMAVENTYQNRVSQEKESGITVKERNGLKLHKIEKNKMTHKFQKCFRNLELITYWTFIF